jgi:hypothetical protein
VLLIIAIFTSAISGEWRKRKRASSIFAEGKAFLEWLNGSPRFDKQGA